MLSVLSRESERLEGHGQGLAAGKRRMCGRRIGEHGQVSARPVASAGHFGTVRGPDQDAQDWFTGCVNISASIHRTAACTGCG